MSMKLLILSLVLALAGGLLEAGLPPETSLAQTETPRPPTPEAPTFHLMYDALLDVPRLPPAEAARAQDTPQATQAPDFAAWSRLVFQSARNEHDWEVFGARGDGSEQVNLSNNGSMDFHPRLNRGATRVVFASNRKGNYDIYAMNADGSAQARLTTNDKDDVYPAWSPDSSRIAFQAYRDGQAEIYVMNADGTGQTRLTKYSDYDGQPAWSPDGTQIAFVRRVEGKNRIWVMNADGSNLRQLSNQPSSEYPTWSPDGSQIAYDADGNGDSWQEIWLMDAAGGNQRQVYDPPESNTDAWVRSWSPDGRSIAFTCISFIQHGGDWYWTTAYLDAWDSASGNVVRLSGNGADWHPDWQSADIWAPTSSVEPLPAHSPWTFTVRWTGADAGPAGIASFDVQVKDGAGGAWTDWHMATLDRSASYTGVGGHSYYFRVRARDYAGNVETWPLDYDAVATLELDLQAPTSSVEPLPAQSPATFTVQWSGADVGPSGMAGFDVQVKDGAAGAWTDWRLATQDRSASYSGLGGHAYSFRSRARDNAGNVEAWPADFDAITTVESMPPVSAVQPLPAFTRGQNVEVQWNGSDPGGSGIAYYDVQAQDANGGSWTDWRTGTATTNATFTGVPGHTYRFRVRGVDLAENVEPWPPGDGDTHTALYLWVISGWVRDSGGAPVGGAAITTSPAALSTALSESEGAYIVRAGADTATYAARIAKTGYGDLPPTTFSGAQDAQLDLVLPPTDNVVRKGNFEEGSLQPDWQTGDAVPAVVTTTLRHTGEQAAWLGGPGPVFTAPVNLTNSAADDTGLQMAPDGAGGVHLFWYVGSPDAALYAWRAHDGTWRVPPEPRPQGTAAVGPDGTVHIVGWNYPNITYTRRAPGGSWSAPVALSTAQLEGEIQIAVSATNVVHVVWLSSFRIYWTSRSPSGTWSEPRDISGPTLRYSVQQPNLAVDQTGAAHVVWTDGHSLTRYACRPPADDWAAPRAIRDGFSFDPPLFAVAVDGTVHVVWPGILHAQGTCQGSWTSPESVGLGSGYPLMAVDRTGTVHVLAHVPDQRLQYVRRPNGGAWSTPQTLAGRPSYTPPNLAADDSGTAHVLWSGGLTSWEPGTIQLYYTRRSGDPAWSPPVNVSGAAQWLSRDNDLHALAVEGNGRVHAGWFDGKDGIMDLYYATSIPVRQADDSTLSQQVTVPAAPAHAGLSFLYRLGGASGAGGNAFSATVKSGSSTTTLFIANTDTADWTHRWFDLQTWAGQAVRLTFTLHQAAGTGPAWAAIDEVTVGSAHPDLWVSRSGPRAAPFGRQFVQDIRYGNRGGVPASNAHVTLQLPPGLAFVSAEPPPAATAPELRWDVGDLAAGSGPSAIRVTLQVVAPATARTTLTSTAAIASDTAEIEQANNSAQAGTFIGYLVYLPVTWR